MGDASRKMRPLTRALHVVLAGCAAHLSAATITVNTTADTVAVDGGCTLREAIANANASSDTTGGDCTAGTGSDTIAFGFPPGTPLPPVINVASTLSLVSSSISIDGPANTINGQIPIVIDGGGSVRVLSVKTPNGDPVAQVHLSGLTIRNGHYANGGAGIYAGSNVLLTVSGCTLTGNTTPFGGGAIVTVNAALVISDSTISGNSADTGGAILTQGALPFLPSLGNQLSPAPCRVTTRGSAVASTPTAMRIGRSRRARSPEIPHRRQVGRSFRSRAERTPRKSTTARFPPTARHWALACIWLRVNGT